MNEIEAIMEEFQLTITQKTTLSTKKGSIHYHLKLNKLSGLIELTYWPAKKQLWVEIHDNRKAEWNQTMIAAFAERVASQFAGEIREQANLNEV